LERLFGIILLILIGSSIAYLFIALVVIPIIKIYQENNRLKR